MKQRAFKQVDVFTSTPYRGNPLAVVLDGTGLALETMQHFTHWTNLSECSFVLPPTPEGVAAGADYRVRIFCPGRELPFAGHPTLGTCHAWLEAGGVPRGEQVVQECGVGLVRIQRNGGRLAFAAPPLIQSGPLSDAELAVIARGLGIARSDITVHSWCDNGPKWRGVMLQSAEQVRSLKPDSAVLAGLEIGVVGPSTPTKASRAEDQAATLEKSSLKNNVQFEVRAFFPGNQGLTEDPVTGSLNAALAQWLIAAGLAPERYVAAQGAALQREGRVHIERSGDGTIWVGGDSVTCINGQVQL